MSFWFSAPVIQLADGRLSVGDVEIPVSAVGAIQVIQPQNAFQERGPKLDPRAFTRFQISVKSMIRLEITDSNDPTPYWLIASRKPEVLAQAIEASKLL